MTDEAQQLINRIEARGYRRGATAILDLATQAADFLEAEYPSTPSTQNTVRAMRALVDSGREMIEGSSTGEVS